MWDFTLALIGQYVCLDESMFLDSARGPSSTYFYSNNNRYVYNVENKISQSYYRTFRWITSIYFFPSGHGNESYNLIGS